MTYAEQLKDPRWLAKRWKVLVYADFRCQICGQARPDSNQTESGLNGSRLQVHHSYYIRGAMAWEYPDGSLIAACARCHAYILRELGFGAVPEAGAPEEGEQ